MVTAYKTHIHLGLEWVALNWCLVCPPTLLWLVKYLQSWKWTICNLRQWKDHVSVLASPPTVRTRCPKRSYEEQSGPTSPHIYDEMGKELIESNSFFSMEKNIICQKLFSGVLSMENQDPSGTGVSIGVVCSWGWFLLGLLFDSAEGTGWASRTPKAMQVSLFQERSHDEAHRKDKNKCCIFMTFQRLA